MRAARLCLAVCALLSRCCGATASQQGEAAARGLAEGSLSFQTPVLSDEEGHSQYMPQHLRCDACRAIAYQMQEYLAKAVHKKRPARGTGGGTGGGTGAGAATLPESELIDSLDRCCSQSWNDYGVKELNGEKRLSGPGLETQSAMGMMMGGGKWPYRLLQMCHAMLGEQGEEEIYAAFRSAEAASGQGLAPWLCRSDCSAGGLAQRDGTAPPHTEM